MLIFNGGLISVTNPLCEGCIIADGVGYNRHGSSCQRFVQCYLEDGTAVAVEKKCGFGQFFSLSDLTCVHSEFSDCPYGNNPQQLL